MRSYWFLTLKSELPSRMLSDTLGSSSTAKAAAYRSAAEPAPRMKPTEHNSNDGVECMIYAMCEMYEGERRLEDSQSRHCNLRSLGAGTHIPRRLSIWYPTFFDVGVM